MGGCPEDARTTPSVARPRVETHLAQCVWVRHVRWRRRLFADTSAVSQSMQTSPYHPIDLTLRAGLLSQAILVPLQIWLYITHIS